jgi:UDP-N-acetylmuramoyl-tripeptide--D-alanyl-D-alanine ligase
MRHFSLEALERMIGARRLGPPGGGFTSVGTDSRQIRGGECFFAIRGGSFDGNDYIGQAFARGAACAVTDRPAAARGLEDRPVLVVDDGVAALGRFANGHRRLAGFKVVAITGSVGKTTTRRIAEHALGRRFRVFSSPRNFNNSIGLPLTLLGADDRHEVVLAELGASFPGEISALSRIAEPDAAVVTAACLAHLDGFGSLEAIIGEKLSISEGLRPGGVLFINGDCGGLVEAARREGLDYTAFGSGEHCQIRYRPAGGDGLSNRFVIDGVEVVLPLIGRGSVQNAAAAWAVCRHLGMTAADFAAAVRAMPQVDMRCRLLEFGTLAVINDCYNASPASMANALDALVRLGAARGRGRLVFICGDMAELGKQTCGLHDQLGRAVAAAAVQCLVAVGDLAGRAAAAAVEASGGRLKAHCFPDAVSACNKLEELIKEYDIVLVKGSRCVRLELAVETLGKIFARQPAAGSRDGLDTR